MCMLMAGLIGVGVMLGVSLPGIANAVGLPRVLMSLSAIAAGIGMNVINRILITAYIEKKTPEFNNPIMRDLTAGTGIVPKWVSLLALVGYILVIAGIVSFFA